MSSIYRYKYNTQLQKSHAQQIVCRRGWAAVSPLLSSTVQVPWRTKLRSSLQTGTRPGPDPVLIQIHVWAGGSSQLCSVSVSVSVSVPSDQDLHHVCVRAVDAALSLSRHRCFWGAWGSRIRTEETVTLCLELRVQQQWKQNKNSKIKTIVCLGFDWQIQSKKVFERFVSKCSGCRFNCGWLD